MGEPGLTHIAAGQTRFPGHAATGRERRRRESNTATGAVRPLRCARLRLGWSPDGHWPVWNRVLP